jgi:hypothetical protein
MDNVVTGRPAPWLRAVRGSRRSGASRWAGQRKLTLTDRDGGVPERREHIVTLKIGIVLKDLLDRPPRRQLADDRTHCRSRCRAGLADLDQVTRPHRFALRGLAMIGDGGTPFGHGRDWVVATVARRAGDCPAALSGHNPAGVGR